MSWGIFSVDMARNNHLLSVLAYMAQYIVVSNALGTLEAHQRAQFPLQSSTDRLDMSDQEDGILPDNELKDNDKVDSFPRVPQESGNEPLERKTRRVGGPVFIFQHTVFIWLLYGYIVCLEP